jgi:hypothetical protein
VAAPIYECIGRVSVRWLERGGRCVELDDLSPLCVLDGGFRFGGLCMLCKRVVRSIKGNGAPERNESCVVVDDLSLHWRLDGGFRVSALWFLFRVVVACGFINDSHTHSNSH